MAKTEKEKCLLLACLLLLGSTICLRKYVFC